MAKKVLIIDDDKLVGKLSVAFFQKLGFESEFCPGAFEGWEMIDDQENHFDLVFSDIKMTREFEGVELLNLVKDSNDPRINDIKFILYSGNHDVLLDEKCAKADKCLRKPLRFDELKNALNDLGIL